MNRPRLIALLASATILTGLVAPALAADTQRSKVCVTQERYLPNGFCVVWDDPTGTQQ